MLRYFKLVVETVVKTVFVVVENVFGAKKLPNTLFIIPDPILSEVVLYIVINSVLDGVEVGPLEIVKLGYAPVIDIPLLPINV